MSHGEQPGVEPSKPDVNLSDLLTTEIFRAKNTNLISQQVHIFRMCTSRE